MITNENVLIAALDERWGKYRAEIRNCKQGFSEEAVHDLRVTTRRLLAVMDMLRTLDPHPRVKKVRRTLKEQLDSLDALRDTQVMLVEVSKTAANFPELKTFQEYLLRREQKLLRKARKETKSLQISALKRRIEKSRPSLKENAKGRGWTAYLLSAVDQAYARAMQAFGQVEAAQPSSIHRFRVTFKKFRYMVEIIYPVLKGYPETYFKQMHDYQSRMGNVQDAEVFVGALEQFAEGELSTMPESVQKIFVNRRAEVIAAFMNAKDEIHLFWRSSLKQKFSWESKNEPVHRPSRNRSGGGNARIRKRQPAPADRQGRKEDAEDRAGAEGIGGGDQPDPHQPISAGRGDGKDPAKGVRPE